MSSFEFMFLALIAFFTVVLAIVATALGNQVVAKSILKIIRITSEALKGLFMVD